MIQHILGILTKPTAEWQSLAALPEDSLRKVALYPCLLAFLPAVAWYFGTSRVGWTVGDEGAAIKLTAESARTLTILFYLAMITALGVIGYFIHWMSSTYGADSSTYKGIMIAGIASTPLYLAGLVGFYPVLWVDLLIGVAAVSWAVYLLYLGIPIIMKIPEERGFLFSSAVLGVALVMLICVMVVSVILWDFGAAPAFTD
jgi:hypothetical protein